MGRGFCGGFAFVALVLLVGTAGPAAAQSAQVTINGSTTTIPLRSDGSGGWSGSGLITPGGDVFVVGVSSGIDFFSTVSLDITLQGQDNGDPTAVGVQVSVPISLPAGPTTVESQASGANLSSVGFPSRVGVGMTGEVSADRGATYQNMGVDLNTSVSLGSVTVGPQPGPSSPPFNFLRVTGTFSPVGGGQIVTTGAEFTIQPGGLGSSPPGAEKAWASGGGRFTSAVTGPVQFALSALRHKDGAVRGTLVYREVDNDFTALVALDCLNVLGSRAVVSGTIIAVSNPDFAGLVGLPAAFSVRDNGQGRKAAPDLVSDLWVLFEDCFDPIVIERTEPVYPLASGNVSVKP
jgi:hypothetical protein